MSIRELMTIQDFNSSLQEAEQSGKALVIDFFADWCGPCKFISPKIEKLAMEFYNDVIFAKVNVDLAQDLSSHCKISAMPTIQAFRYGKMIGQVVGANEPEIRSLVIKVKTPTN